MFFVLLSLWLAPFALCSFIFPIEVDGQEDKRCWSHEGSTGDPCTNSNQYGGRNGQCRSAYDCPWALMQIQQHRQIDICSFNGRIPIICCPLNPTESQEKPVQSGDVEKSTSPVIELPLKTGSSNFGELSKAKCEEFYPRPEGFHTVAVGGESSLAQEFPHMAILGYGTDDEKQWKCGGSLISLKHVLTAAHCLSSRDLGPVKYVRLGDLDIKSNEDDAEPQEFTVLKATPHANFDPRTLKNDIAILELNKLVKLTDYVKPSCLHTENKIDPDKEITATGWGITEFAGEPSSHLIKVFLKITEHTDCQKEYSRFGVRGEIDASQICAGSSDDVKIMDTCQGDSGGPLQLTNYTNRKHYHILGITSFGKACGVTRSSGIYTKVSFYIPWIESVVFES